MTDRDLISAQKVAAILNQRRPDSALSIQADVTDWDQIQKAVEATVAKFGRLDIAINSAGVVLGKELKLVKVSTYLDEWQVSSKRD